MKEPLKSAAWTALVYSVLTVAHAAEAVKKQAGRVKKREVRERDPRPGEPLDEDRYRRQIASVWDALG